MIGAAHQGLYPWGTCRVCGQRKRVVTCLPGRVGRVFVHANPYDRARKCGGSYLLPKNLERIKS